MSKSTLIRFWKNGSRAPVAAAKSGDSEAPSFGDSLSSSFFSSRDLFGDLPFDSSLKRTTDIVNDKRKGLVKLCAYLRAYEGRVFI